LNVDSLKTIAAAIGGAVVASGLMYFIMRPDRSVEQPAEMPVTEVQPVKPVETPAAVTPAPEEPFRPIERRSVTRQKQPAKRQSATAVPSKPVTVAQTTPPQPPATQQPPTSKSSDLVWTPPPPPAGTADSKVVEEPKPARVPQTVTIPAGTLLSIRVDQSLSTKTNQTGDSFRASLDQPLVVDNLVIAERGARIEGRIVESDPGGRVQGVAKLQLELVRLNTSDGQRLRLQTESFSKDAPQQKGRDAAKIGAAAGIGAAIGAIAGGGKGAAIGAAVGGASGAGGIAATRGAPAEIPSETRMTFKLRDPITVTEKLD
jgi:hypothetical protein